MDAVQGSGRRGTRVQAVAMNVVGDLANRGWRVVFGCQLENVQVMVQGTHDRLPVLLKFLPG